MSETTSDPRAVRRARDDDRHAVATVLARSFHDDPLMRWVFPNEGRRLDANERLFLMEAGQTYFPRGQVYLTASGQAAAMWLPPGEREGGSVLRLLWHLPALVRAMGIRRIVPAFRSLSLVDGKHPQEPHYYLGAVGVDPEFQGQGLGSALIELGTARCDEERMPSYLVSSNPRNLPLYERHGFEVIEEIELPSGGPTLWRMWRDPVA